MFCLNFNSNCFILLLFAISLLFKSNDSIRAPVLYIYNMNERPHSGNQWQSHQNQDLQYNNRKNFQPQGQPYINNNNVNNNNNINNINNNNNRQPSYEGHPNLQNRHLNIPKNAYSHMDEKLHKCRLWVPTSVVDKYQFAKKLQIDNANSLQLIEDCCEGYAPIRWRGNTICRPRCDNCKNGICISPGVCQCHEGFVSNDNGDCVFKCPLGCLNGQCYLDNSCVCDPGYKLDESRSFCRPICSAGCGGNIRHNCTEPEVCSCAKGFQLGKIECEPVCEPECGIGGTCVDVNQCKCESHLGYKLINGVCQSDCYQKCQNGICYERNRCICNSGFTYHEKSTTCVPK